MVESNMFIVCFNILPFHRQFAMQTGSGQLVQGSPEKHMDLTHHHQQGLVQDRQVEQCIHLLLFVVVDCLL